MSTPVLTPLSLADREIAIRAYLERTDLTSYERNAARKALLDITAEKLGTPCVDEVVKRPQKNQKTLGSLLNLAKLSGMTESVAWRAVHHVAAVEAHPEWTQYPQKRVLALARKLEGKEAPVRRMTPTVGKMPRLSRPVQSRSPKPYNRLEDEASANNVTAILERARHAIHSELQSLEGIDHECLSPNLQSKWTRCADLAAAIAADIAGTLRTPGA